MQAGYRVKLVNTSAVRQYEGLKHRDDCDDAFHLAQLLRLGFLPCGYIYPRRRRAVRDLLRHRCRLVRQRTMNVLAAKSCYARELNMKVSSAVMIGTKQQPWPVVEEPQIALVIDAHRVIIGALTQQIRRIETVVRQELKDAPAYRRLQTVNGIGPILAWTIGLEVGDIHRFGLPTGGHRGDSSGYGGEAAPATANQAEPALEFDPERPSLSQGAGTGATLRMRNSREAGWSNSKQQGSHSHHRSILTAVL